MKKIIITGGGTAGHVTPNLALLPFFKKHFDEIHYIGSINGIEKKIISKYKDIIYHEITTVKLIRAFNLTNLLIPFKLIKSFFQCKKIIKEIKPSIIFSKGGFVAVPVALAGNALKIPIIAHESDITMGLANKIIYKKCKKMCFSFKNDLPKYKEKGVFTGSPIRLQIFSGNKLNIFNKYKLNLLKKNILVVGGSSGAKAINDVIFNSATSLTKKYNILHIVGKNNINKNINLNNYYQIEYADNIEDYFDASDIIISRAGSNSIFEFLAKQKPNILIPLPIDCSRGDQILNAEYFKNSGYSFVIEQKNLSEKILNSSIEYVLMHKFQYIQKMKNAKELINGTKNIEKVISEYI